MTKYLETDYWEDADYIKWSEENLAMFDLSKNDIQALTELGLPEWVAPNINFDHFELEPDTLKLGEDREDRDIYMLRGSSRILVGNNINTICMILHACILTHTHTYIYA